MSAAAPESGDGYSPRLLWRRAAEGRQLTFSPEYCAAYLTELAAEPEDRYARGAILGIGLLVRCTGPWPDGLEANARVLVRKELDNREDGGVPFAVLAFAALAGPDLYAEAAARAEAACGPIAREELRLLAGWDAAGLALLAHAAPAFARVCPLDPLPDLWDRLIDRGYGAFTRPLLEAAVERVGALHAGEIPFAADKAFDPDEVETLGRAARVALAHDEPWLPDVLDRIVRGVAVAPTAAKSLPSQALLYELARAAQDFPIPELAASLRTARRITRHRGVPKQLDKYLKKIDAALADRTEVALRLPDLGFAADGTLRTPLGGHEAVVTVTGDTAELAWYGPGGKALRSVPAAVRRDHAGTVKELRELVKRVGTHLTTLARALESGLPSEMAMPYAEWRTRLRDHPVAGAVARRLIWEVETAPGEWRAFLPGQGPGDLPPTPQSGDSASGDDVSKGSVTGEGAPDADVSDGGGPYGGAPGREPGDAARVRLWHPIRSEPEEVRAWRELLTERRIRQPFKQAFREIYLLTPAEREAGHRSARFAAHIVRYRQLFALFRARGWTSRLLGPWDGGDEDTAERTLASGEWRVSLDHEYAEPTADHELAVTGKVGFARREGGTWRETPLDEVPAVVFSEAMRDVDLFVGVTSIATDPEWVTRAEAVHVGYWREAGFGELPASAQVRRDALARIIPRTRIAGRCSIEGRFLVVRGDLRTYKIHIGSGNILMEPDDSYLCIVPAREKSTGGKDRVFLPFEDERLAVILSKAFMLAADTAITDPAILAQIK